MSKAKPWPRMSGPRKPRSRACSTACSMRSLRERVLAAHVEVAVLAAGRVRGDRHRLDDGERVALHEHAVLERARLGLVGVADQVVRAARLARDGVPLAPHRERGAAAPDEARVDDLADHALGAELDRAPQRVVAAVGAVVVEALGVDRADAAQQPQRLGSPSWGGVGRRRLRAACAPPRIAMTPSASTSVSSRSSGSSPASVSIAAGARSHWPRHGLRSHVAPSTSVPSGPSAP